MEFSMILLVFPIISLVVGVIGQMLIKRVYIVVGIVFFAWLIAMFTLFNNTFLIWVFVYSALALLGAGGVYFLKRLKSSEM